jgi:hypothetical protein
MDKNAVRRCAMFGNLEVIQEEGAGKVVAITHEGLRLHELIFTMKAERDLLIGSVPEHLRDSPYNVFEDEDGSTIVQFVDEVPPAQTA